MKEQSRDSTHDASGAQAPVSQLGSDEVSSQLASLAKVSSLAHCGTDLQSLSWMNPASLANLASITMDNGLPTTDLSFQQQLASFSAQWPGFPTDTTFPQRSASFAASFAAMSQMAAHNESMQGTGTEADMLAPTYLPTLVSSADVGLRTASSSVVAPSGQVDVPSAGSASGVHINAAHLQAAGSDLATCRIPAFSELGAVSSSVQDAANFQKMSVSRTLSGIQGSQAPSWQGISLEAAVGKPNLPPQTDVAMHAPGSPPISEIKHQSAPRTFSNSSCNDEVFSQIPRRTLSINGAGKLTVGDIQTEIQICDSIQPSDVELLDLPPDSNLSVQKAKQISTEGTGTSSFQGTLLNSAPMHSNSQVIQQSGSSGDAQGVKAVKPKPKWWYTSFAREAPPENSTIQQVPDLQAGVAEQNNMNQLQLSMCPVPNVTTLPVNDAAVWVNGAFQSDVNAWLGNQVSNWAQFHSCISQLPKPTGSVVTPVAKHPVLSVAKRSYLRKKPPRPMDNSRRPQSNSLPATENGENTVSQVSRQLLKAKLMARIASRTNRDVDTSS